MSYPLFVYFFRERLKFSCWILNSVFITFYFSLMYKLGMYFSLCYTPLKIKLHGINNVKIFPSQVLTMNLWMNTNFKIGKEEKQWKEKLKNEEGV